MTAGGLDEDREVGRPRAVDVPAALYPVRLVRDLMVDGRPLRIRPVRPDDALRLGEMLQTCSGDDVRLRFNGAMRALTPALAASRLPIRRKCG